MFAVEVCPSSTAATSRYDGGDEEDDSTAVITRMPPQMAMKLTTAPPPSHSVVWEFYVQQQVRGQGRGGSTNRPLTSVPMPAAARASGWSGVVPQGRRTSV